MLFRALVGLTERKTFVALQSSTQARNVASSQRRTWPPGEEGVAVFFYTKLVRFGKDSLLFLFTMGAKLVFCHSNKTSPACSADLRQETNGAFCCRIFGDFLGFGKERSEMNKSRKARSTEFWLGQEVDDVKRS